MRCMSISAERQKDAEVVICGTEATTFIRRNAAEKTSDEGKFWECDEAYMVLPAEDAPAAEEIMEDLETWFDYAAGWHEPRVRSREQLQADVEYIAALTGIDLEV